MCESHSSRHMYRTCRKKMFFSLVFEGSLLFGGGIRYGISGGELANRRHWASSGMVVGGSSDRQPALITPSAFPVFCFFVFFLPKYPFSTLSRMIFDPDLVALIDPASTGISHPQFILPSFLPRQHHSITKSKPP